MLRRVGRPVARALVHDQPLEPHALDVGVRRLVVKLVEVRLGRRVPEQVFRGHHDERLAERAVQLAPQQVEVVGRRRHVGDLPVGALDLASEVAPDGPLGVVDVLKSFEVFFFFPEEGKKVSFFLFLFFSLSSHLSHLSLLSPPSPYPHIKYSPEAPCVLFSQVYYLLIFTKGFRMLFCYTLLFLFPLVFEKRREEREGQKRKMKKREMRFQPRLFKRRRGQTTSLFLSLSLPSPSSPIKRGTCALPLFMPPPRHPFKMTRSAFPLLVGALLLCAATSAQVRRSEKKN